MGFTIKVPDGYDVARHGSPGGWLCTIRKRVPFGQPRPRVVAYMGFPVWIFLDVVPKLTLFGASECEEKLAKRRRWLPRDCNAPKGRDNFVVWTLAPDDESMRELERIVKTFEF